MVEFEWQLFSWKPNFMFTELFNNYCYTTSLSFGSTWFLRPKSFQATQTDCFFFTFPSTELIIFGFAVEVSTCNTHSFSKSLSMVYWGWISKICRRIIYETIHTDLNFACILGQGFNNILLVGQGFNIILLIGQDFNPFVSRVRL